MEKPPLHEELELLRRILQEETFRFVLAEYNHFDAVKQAEVFIRKQFPRRSLLILHIKGNNFRRFSKQMHEFGRGIVFVPDFDELFRPENDDFRIAFNQRRDWLAERPVALLCFLPPGALRKVMESLPDFWSRRDAELTLWTELPERERGLPIAPGAPSSLGGLRAGEKTAELQRLRSEIAAADPGNFTLLDSLYRQLLPLLEDTGDYSAGLEAARNYFLLADRYDARSPSITDLTYAHDRLAIFHQYLGHYTDADFHFRKALQLAKQAGEETDISRVQNNYANLLGDLGEYDKARDLLEAALASDLKNFGPDHPNVAVSQSNLALVYKDIGQYDSSRDLLEAALVSDLKNFGPDHPNVAERQNNLAEVYRNLGQYEKARDLFEAALASALKNFGPDHPKVADRQNNIANVYLYLGQYDRARDLLEAALASALKNFGPDHPSVAVSQSNLALVYSALGQNEKARDLLEVALSSDLKNFDSDHPTVAVHQSNLANVYSDLGQNEKARDLLEAALASDLKNFGADHPNVAVHHNNLAHVLRDMGQYEEAVAHFQRALAIVREKMGEGHPYMKTFSESLQATIEEGAAAGDAEMQALLEGLR